MDGGGSWVGRIRLGGQGGSERRIVVILKMQNKNVGWGRGVRSSRGWGVEGWGGVGRGGRGWFVARLGIGSDVGYGGCGPRIEGIVQCT